MKKTLSAFLLALILLTSGARAEISQNKYLAAAFSALETGNPFTARYEEITGAQITPVFETGIPYTFGGQDARYLFKIRKITQPSKYGDVGAKCIWGFDCSGFTRWIQAQVGDKAHPGLSAMILDRKTYKNYRMENLILEGGTFQPSYMKKGDPRMTPEQIAENLEYGDFLAAKHSGRHILMYIGTLREYGYDAESAPELAAYLDYPLMVNCGNDPNYKARTQAYIDANGLDARPSLGGATVSIVGMKETDAPHLREDGAKPFYYYQLGDYQLSVYDLPAATSYVFWRTIDADRGAV